MRVYSNSYWLVIFFVAAECWRGRGGKLSRIFGKNTIFNERPVSEIEKKYCFAIPSNIVTEIQKKIPALSWHEEVEPGEGNHVDRKLPQVSIQLPREPTWT